MSEADLYALAWVAVLTLNIGVAGWILADAGLERADPRDAQASPHQGPLMTDAITQAWLDKGSHPRYHDAQIARLRREWPVLADAIEKHVRAQERPSGDLPMGVRPHPPQPS